MKIQNHDLDQPNKWNGMEWNRIYIIAGLLSLKIDLSVS